MATDLRTRPLRAISIDRPLWADREDELAVLERAVNFGFNALVLAEPGAGKTSLANMLAARLEDGGRSVAQIPARRADGPADVIGAAAEALQEPDDGIQPSGDGTSFRDALDRLVAATSDSPRPPVIIVDDIGGRLGHELFGRARDEIWTVSAIWIALGRLDEEALLLTPPADAFFEFVQHLRPLPQAGIAAALRARDDDELLSEETIEAIASQSHGNPSRALRIARAALSDSGADAAVLAAGIDQIRAKLGSSAERLADELARFGPASPSDPELLSRLGWTAPRSYQVFRELEDAGFVTASFERSGGPGRPRKIYRLVEGT